MLYMYVCVNMMMWTGPAVLSGGHDDQKSKIVIKWTRGVE